MNLVNARTSDKFSGRTTLITFIQVNPVNFRSASNTFRHDRGVVWISGLFFYSTHHTRESIVRTTGSQQLPRYTSCLYVF